MSKRELDYYARSLIYVRVRTGDGDSALILTEDEDSDGGIFNLTSRNVDGDEDAGGLVLTIDDLRYLAELLAVAIPLAERSEELRMAREYPEAEEAKQ